MRDAGAQIDPTKLLGGTGQGEPDAAAIVPAAEVPPEEEEIDPRYASPEATMATFLDAINSYYGSEDDPDTPQQVHARLEWKKAAFGAVVRPEGWTETRLGRHGISLYNVLNRIGYIDASTLPDEKEMDERGSESFEFFPRYDIPDDEMFLINFMMHGFENVRERAPTDAVIEIVRTEDGTWRFSARTMQGAEELYLSAEALQVYTGHDVLTPAARFRRWIPYWAKGNEFLGIELYKWIAIGVVVFLGVLLDFTVRILLRFATVRAMRKRGVEPDKKMVRRSIRPFGMFAAAIFWSMIIGSGLLGLPDQAYTAIELAVKVILMLSAVWSAYRLTDLVTDFFVRKARHTDTKFDDLIIPLIRKTIKILLTAIGMIYIANSFRVDITPLLTGLGIGGVAFAIAAKDTIENFFGSIAVIMDRPFEVGDWIVVGDVEGTVEEMGMRSTRVRTFYNSLMTVPNSTLVRATVDNYGRRKFRRFKTSLSVSYSTPADSIEAFCGGIRELIRVHPYTRKDYYHVWLNEFGPSSVNIMLYLFFETPEWATELRERHRFMLDVMRLADQLGVRFALPAQTLHMIEQKPDQTKQPDEIPDSNEMTEATRAGRKAARQLTARQPYVRDVPSPVSFPTPEVITKEDVRPGMREVADKEPEEESDDRV